MSFPQRDYRHRSCRPALTPLLLCSAALWAGCAAAYGAFPPLEPSSARILAMAAAVAGAAGEAFVLFRRRAASLSAAAMLFLGAALGWSAAASLQEQALHVAGVPAGPITLTMLEDSSDTGFGEGALARAQWDDGTALAVTARLSQGTPFFYGQRLSCYGSFEALDPESDAFAWAKGAGGALQVKTWEEAPSPLDPLISLRKRAIEALGARGGEAAAVLQAVVCGYRRDVKGSDAYRAYQTCGLAHLIAVSGAHLVVVTGLFGTLLKSLGCPRRIAVALLAAAMGGYLLFSAAPLSALRATVMSSVGLFSLFGRRRPSSLNGLGAAMAFTVLASPAASVSVSFALSALSTAGIVLFAPLMQEWFSTGILGRIPLIADGLSLTLASSLLAQLYGCSVFSLLPVVSPLANIASAPFFAPLCGLGLLGAGAAILSLPGADLLLGAAHGIAGALCGLADTLAGLPFAAVPFTCSGLFALGASGAAAALLWTIWPSGRQMVPIAVLDLLLIGACCFIPFPGDRIVMLDVGQGDAVLIQSRGRSVLIDTGNRDTQLLRGLASQGVVSLDAVLVTHGDDDHCGSLDALESAVRVDTALLAADTWHCGADNARDLLQDAERCARMLQPLAKGDRLHWGAFTATVLHPEKFQDEGGNGDSLCIWLEYDGNGDGISDATALFTGDAEKDELRTMTTEFGLHDVDILKVGHHGSKNAFDLETVKTLNPRIALIGVGENNRYGHPHPRTLELLEAIGTQVLRTDTDGEVACTLTPSGIEVHPMA